MEEFLGVNASYLAYQRLNNIKNERAELQPEIQLLNPQEGAKRLQPLEDAGWLLGLFCRFWNSRGDSELSWSL